MYHLFCYLLLLDGRFFWGQLWNSHSLVILRRKLTLLLLLAALPQQCITLIFPWASLRFFRPLAGQRRVLRLTVYRLHHNHLGLLRTWTHLTACICNFRFIVEILQICHSMFCQEAEKCVSINTNKHVFFVGRWHDGEVQQWLLWRTRVWLYSGMIAPRVWNKHAAGIPLISQRGRHFCGLPFILLAWHKDHAAFMKTWKALSEPECIYYMLLKKFETSEVKRSYLDASVAGAFQLVY